MQALGAGAEQKVENEGKKVCREKRIREWKKSACSLNIYLSFTYSQPDTVLLFHRTMVNRT